MFACYNIPEVVPIVEALMRWRGLSSNGGWSSRVVVDVFLLKAGQQATLAAARKEGRRGVPSFCQSSNLEHASCGTLPAFLRIISNTTRPSSRPKTAHYRSRVLKTLLPEIHENDRLGLV
jgi:hypothetical protein